MPHKRTQEIPETRNRQLDQTETDGQSKHDGRRSERTEETIKKTEKDFALDLLMLVDETTRVVKILSAIAALENLTRRYILPVLSTQKSSYHQIWSSLLQ